PIFDEHGLPRSGRGTFLSRNRILERGVDEDGCSCCDPAVSLLIPKDLVCICGEGDGMALTERECAFEVPEWNRREQRIAMVSLVRHGAPPPIRLSTKTEG